MPVFFLNIIMLVGFASLAALGALWWTARDW
ncbi:Uncharacterised protein [Bergeriella denitrificans]|uniref:Uncharacterized protein n=1 Tax=Bergeriella denitrificans TaxID=494 RepID=A0A378UJW7_BERDE|nr:Uncharacterised protein [Bergeriella denitrificans]